MNCVYLNEQGRSLPMVMGCYGIGVTRTFQAMIEQHHDDEERDGAYSAVNKGGEQR